MSDRSAIEWTETTWNPTTGCDQVSTGCDHCYALTLAKRLKAAGNPRYQVDGDPRTSGPGFGLTLHWDKVEQPLRWRSPRVVFVNSMSDLFHEDVPLDFLAAVWDVMVRTPQHTYQILTKRPHHMARRLGPRGIGFYAYEGPVLQPQPNIWLGTSVEDQKWANVRIPHLLRTPAAVRFLSCEPLLGPVHLSSWLEQMDYHGNDSTAAVFRPSLHWVIVGGESGPHHRSMDPDWARSVRDECVEAGVAFFFKQHGGRTPKAGGRTLDGRTWDELPPRSAEPPRLSA